MENNFKVPNFQSERAEADWWEASQDEIAAQFEKAATEGKLGHGTALRKGSTPTTTIRLDPADISRAKDQADRRGLKYQTYLKSLIHKALWDEEIENRFKRAPVSLPADIEYEIDARQFQMPLVSLTETLAQKMQREVPKLISAPTFVPVDLFVMIRQAMYTYNLLCYVNADERREKDNSWHPAYTFVTIPLVRSMIDDLYNVTFILLNPAKHGREFRLAGFKKEFSDLKNDEERYRGRPKWDEYNSRKRAMLSFAVRESNFTEAEVAIAKPWKTLGKYLTEQTKESNIEHKEFLAKFTHLMWREYSAISHGGFEGLLDVGLYFTKDSVRHELRPQLDEVLLRLVSMHMMRASLVLLSLITEIQLTFRFRDANINQRLADIWKVVLPALESQELYEHYAPLMKAANIL